MERGLVGVKTNVLDETTKIHEKISTDDHVLSEFLKQQKYENEQEPSWKDKPLHGMYHRQWLIKKNSSYTYIYNS